AVAIAGNHVVFIRAVLCISYILFVCRVKKARGKRYRAAHAAWGRVKLLKWVRSSVIIQKEVGARGSNRPDIPAGRLP
ncbi:hypothetical protein, partial [Alcanivorax sp. HI0083]